MNGGATAHLALVGPTATGKSALALAVAEHLGDVEIVSVDSMQVYRGMDVGTAKASPAERARVPHHLIDVADPWEEWSVVRFRDAVRAAVDDIASRGRRALLVGGTGLYFRAAVDDLGFPGEDPRTRAALEAKADRPGGVDDLYAELASADPEAAARIEPANRRRIVRALEVIRATGRPFSSFGPGLETYGEPIFPIEIAGLRLARPRLRARIGDRLAHMRAQGLVDEVRGLVAHARGLSRTARQAIGYREVIDSIEGRISEDDAFAQAERRTWRFARRQLKWFERDPRIRWVDLPEGIDVGNAGDVLTLLLESWSECRAPA